MGKSERKAVEADTKKQQAQSAANYSGFNQQIQDRVNAVAPRADDERSQVWEGYKNGLDTGYVDPAAAARLRGIYQTPTGSSIEAPESGSSGASSISDPNRIDPMSVFNSIAGNGGDFESYGGYRGFADNGGFSGADQTNFRNQATAVVPSLYKAMQRQLDLQGSRQGAYNTGLAAAQSRLGRQGAQEMSGATLNAEANLAQQIREGRLAGLGGMSNIESQRNTNKMTAAKQLQDAIQAQQAASAAASNAAAAREFAIQQAMAGNEKYLIDAQQQGKLSGLGSLSQLYQSGGSGELQNLYGTQLSGYGGGDASQLNALGLRQQNAAVPAWYESMLKAAVPSGVSALTSAFMPTGGVTQRQQANFTPADAGW
jgi:hypothetical protein